MTSFADRVHKRQSFVQKIIGAVLRLALKSLLKPVLHPRFNVSFQRRWMGLVASTTLKARDVDSYDDVLAGVRCRHYQPALSEKSSEVGTVGTVLYLHGGAYVAGNPDSHKALTSHLAKFADAHVVVPDYRLAPEHECPAAINDAVAVYKALLEQGVPPEQLSIAGDSAGGGLALATVQALKANGVALPSSVILYSPWVDLTLSELNDTDQEVMLSEAWLASAAQVYAGSEHIASPMCSPIYGDLTGLPPVLIQVGSDEILLNDSHRTCEALNRAGTVASLQVYPQRWHVFQLHAGVLADADISLMTSAQFLHQHWLASKK
jgi:monoterpene epsilon-lactone hydrolase